MTVSDSDGGCASAFSAETMDILTNGIPLRLAMRLLVDPPLRFRLLLAAHESYSDPYETARCERLRRQGSPIGFLRPDTSVRRRRATGAAQICKANILDKLRQGELIAAGRFKSQAGPWRDIPTALWPDLSVAVWQTGHVNGAESFRDVRIARPYGILAETAMFAIGGAADVAAYERLFVAALNRELTTTEALEQSAAYQRLVAVAIEALRAGLLVAGEPQEDGFPHPALSRDSWQPPAEIAWPASRAFLPCSGWRDVKFITVLPTDQSDVETVTHGAANPPSQIPRTKVSTPAKEIPTKQRDLGGRPGHACTEAFDSEYQRYRDEHPKADKNAIRTHMRWWLRTEWQEKQPSSKWVQTRLENLWQKLAKT